MAFLFINSKKLATEVNMNCHGMGLDVIDRKNINALIQF